MDARDLALANTDIKSSRGAAGIEAILILPVIFMLFYAIATYGMIFYTQHLLNHIAAEALRRGVSYVNEQCLVSGTSGCGQAELAAQVRSNTEALFRDFLSNPERIFGRERAAALTVDIDEAECCRLTLSYNYRDYPFIPPLLPVPEVIQTHARLTF
ncbi:TadE family protein [Zobellella denitrificans]|jgi:hypothetical protein|nr:TadE family protein [Zobellella denitrificans]